jgi:hypothetical protein
MWVRVAIDEAMTIRTIEAVTDAAPYRICPTVTDNFRRLEGLAIRPGFLSRVRELLGGTEGCTHLVELMGPLATTVYQTVWSKRFEAPRDAAGAPPLLDSCRAFARDGDIVRRLWPAFYQAPK